MEPEPELEPSTAEVDETLLEWYLQLSVTERLRAASQNAATMERLRRAAATDR